MKKGKFVLNPSHNSRMSMRLACMRLEAVKGYLYEIAPDFDFVKIEETLIKVMKQSLKENPDNL